MYLTFVIIEYFNLLDQYCQSVMVNYQGFNVIWNDTLSGVTVESPCVGVGLDGQSGRVAYINSLV